MFGKALKYILQRKVFQLKVKSIKNRQPLRRNNFYIASMKYGRVSELDERPSNDSLVIVYYLTTIFDQFNG